MAKGVTASGEKKILEKKKDTGKLNQTFHL